MVLHYSFYILFFTFIRVYSVEYVYPVAYLNDETTIFLIHQLSSDHIELLQWNAQTNCTQQILWSLFNPAGFQLLRDNSGFSFIDNGRLRIKSFNKRSPKTIDFDEPLFNINSLYWIDEHSCYCSAQQGNDYALFHLHDDGRINFIVACNNKDYLYPQKINTHLFYIERDKTNNSHNNTPSYHIVQALCPMHDALDAQEIIDFKDRPIAFLHMLSHTEGCVIEYQKKVDTSDKTMLFFYHHIIKEGDFWYKKELFSFCIPCALLIHGSKELLYESMAPLLPQIVENKIYYVTSLLSEDYFLRPYYYDLLTGVCAKIILPSQRQGHCFVPKPCANRLYYGGTKRPEEYELISFLT